MASIGLSTGDVLSTIKLVNRVVQCVNGVRNAREDFQELLSELQGLSRALNEFSELTQVPNQTPEIRALKFASCSCDETLQRFYEKIQPFTGTLGVDSQRSKFKAAPRMVRWELLIKKDVPELRGYLVAHVGALNLRLSTALLKSSSASQIQGNRIIQQQDINANNLLQLAKDQAAIVEKISQISTTDTVPKLDSLLSIALGVWQSQNEIMSQLAKASQSLPPPDLDHTWAQSPFKFEDALGRRFVIPSEYDWDKVEAIIQAHFKKGPGSVKVRSGDYELFDQRTGLSIKESNFFMLVPGSYITMSIILGRYRGLGLAPESCTRAVCRSSRVKIINSLTTACLECQSTFRIANKALPRPMKPVVSPRTIMETIVPATEKDHLAWLDSRLYKNMSIYFVELPATPAKFREKYTRGYTRPVPRLTDTSPAQSRPQKKLQLSIPDRKPSIIARFLGRGHSPGVSEPPTASQRNSNGLRSTLQGQISRTPLARLNFHSSAQETYFRRSKSPSSDSEISSVNPSSSPAPKSQLSPEFWTQDTVTSFLNHHQFSTDWINTLIALDIHGNTFLELGARYGGRGNFGKLHMEVYPRLARECKNSGTGWDQVREREEGKRLRRLIREVANGKYVYTGSNDIICEELHEEVPSA
ncbi:hypothetical protein N431DRAFT_400365 [Stipitochalara longipes BDJ]|nr:hypothetical protein N431DRAFT_400365 [Stipitochalara longipes BDJ]